MRPFYDFLNFRLPTYGLMIVIGLLLANLIGYLIVKYVQLDFNDFLILESFSFIGGIIGAKLLYILVSFSSIDWKRLGELEYFLFFLRTGFVFYGGFLGGILAILFAGRLFKLPIASYLRHFVGLVPLVHSFGRIGCFLAGCCYGVPYSGLGCVIFPKGSFAPSGIKLFPIQAVEALLLLIIATLIIVADLRKNFSYTVELYLILYSFTRFFLEYFRNDSQRGRLLGFSTSQWISLLLAISAFFIYNRKSKKSIQNYEKNGDNQ